VTEASASGAGFDLDFEIRADHLVDFLRLRQATLNRVGGIIAIGLVIVGVYFVVSGDRILGAFEIVVGSLMFVTSQTRVFDTWRVKRAAKAIIGTRAQFRVDESGIKVDNAGQSATAEWASITELKSSDAIIIPMRGRLPLGWIPTDAFASPEARADALRFMREQVAMAQAPGPSSTP
jgi:hypothetical protein